MIYTVAQVLNGEGETVTPEDLIEYAKTDDVVNKEDFNELTTIVAGKLDAEPQHKHDIAHIKELQSALNNKYDISMKYAYNTILSNPEEIAYLIAPKVNQLEVSVGQENGYTISVDSTNNDLYIKDASGALIASYSSSGWMFNGVTMSKIVQDINYLTTTRDALTPMLLNHKLIDKWTGEFMTGGTIYFQSFTITTAVQPGDAFLLCIPHDLSQNDTGKYRCLVSTYGVGYYSSSHESVCLGFGMILPCTGTKNALTLAPTRTEEEYGGYDNRQTYIDLEWEGPCFMFHLRPFSAMIVEV